MTTTNNIGAQGLTWTAFGAECLQCVFDLRWMLIFAAILIGTDFWWGCRELAMKRRQVTRSVDKERFKFHFSQAGRRTLNKTVDYLTYLLVGCVSGLAITEPMGIAGHTTTAAVGLGFGCLFELSSIVGHIAAVKGINIKLNLKKLIVAIIKKKNEDIADILDEGIEEIDDNRRHHNIHLPHYRGGFDYDHDNGDVFPNYESNNEENNETEIEENSEEE